MSSPVVRDRIDSDEHAYEQVFGPFERGEFRELTEQEWRELIDGKRKTEHDPDSWALPPKVQAPRETGSTPPEPHARRRRCASQPPRLFSLSPFLRPASSPSVPMCSSRSGHSMA